MKTEIINAYRKTLAELDENLRKLNELVTAHSDHPEEDLNWGHVGDLGHVKCRLEELNEFMGGTN